ncbi:MAG: hypothetical protein AB8I08_25670 [Sandaracinaceae bacterium]
MHYYLTDPDERVFVTLSTDPGTAPGLSEDIAHAHVFAEKDLAEAALEHLDPRLGPLVVTSVRQLRARFDAARMYNSWVWIATVDAPTPWEAPTWNRLEPALSPLMKCRRGPAEVLYATHRQGKTRYAEGAKWGGRRAWLLKAGETEESFESFRAFVPQRTAWVLRPPDCMLHFSRCATKKGMGRRYRWLMGLHVAHDAKCADSVAGAIEAIEGLGHLAAKLTASLPWGQRIREGGGYSNPLMDLPLRRLFVDGGHLGIQEGVSEAHFEPDWSLEHLGDANRVETAEERRLDTLVRQLEAAKDAHVVEVRGQPMLQMTLADGGRRTTALPPEGRERLLAALAAKTAD